MDENNNFIIEKEPEGKIEIFLRVKPLTFDANLSEQILYEFHGKTVAVFAPKKKKI